MATFGDVFESCAIDPGNSGGHHGKVDVIDHGMGITGLAFATANVLFDLFETRFDFPPGAMVLNDLFSGQIKVSRKQSNPLCVTINPDNPDRAFQGFEHDHL